MPKLICEACEAECESELEDIPKVNGEYVCLSDRGASDWVEQSPKKYPLIKSGAQMSLLRDRHWALRGQRKANRDRR